jgi:hypothetical protein
VVANTIWKENENKLEKEAQLIIGDTKLTNSQRKSTSDDVFGIIGIFLELFDDHEVRSSFIEKFSI